MRKCLLLFLLAPLTLCAQQSHDYLGVRLGYSGANIVFPESEQIRVRFFGYVFDPGNTFPAPGGSLGFSKELRSNLYLDAGIAPFFGQR